MYIYESGKVYMRAAIQKSLIWSFYMNFLLFFSKIFLSQL